MKKIKFLLICLSLVFLVSGCQKPPETADSLLQKVLAAHGSDGGLQKVQGLLLHGHVNALTNEGQGKLWILYRHPGKLRVVIELTDATEERLYLQGKGWLDQGQGFAPVSGMPLDMMKFQTEHLSLPLRLIDDMYQVRLLDAVSGDNLIGLMLTDAEGLETKIKIDPARSVIRTVERELDVNGKKAMLGVVYEEYRTVKGVQLPHRILTFVNGKPVGRTDFTSIQTNPSIPENLFSVPGKQAG